MLHVVNSAVVKSAADSFDPYRRIAPWISGFEEPLRQAMNDASALVTAADTAQWNAALLAGLGDARRRASVARWRQGAAAWQRWADRVRGLQSQLAIDARAERLLAWLAFADFSYQAFPQTVDFTAADLPAGASFEGAQFLCDAWFSGARFGAGANYHGARFCRDACFEQCWFGGPADFQEALFAGSVRATAAVALCGISACKANFGRDLWMRSCQFFGPVEFMQARIAGEAGFGKCTFARDVDFSKVEFCDNASFEESIFAGEALFEQASFGRHARFERSHFTTQPRFKAARFFRTCHFDDAMIPIIDHNDFGLNRSKVVIETGSL